MIDFQTFSNCINFLKNSHSCLNTLPTPLQFLVENKYVKNSCSSVTIEKHMALVLKYWSETIFQKFLNVADGVHQVPRNSLQLMSWNKKHKLQYLNSKISVTGRYPLGGYSVCAENQRNFFSYTLKILYIKICKYF